MSNKEKKGWLVKLIFATGEVKRTAEIPVRADDSSDAVEEARALFDQRNILEIVSVKEVIE